VSLRLLAAFRRLSLKTQLLAVLASLLLLALGTLFGLHLISEQRLLAQVGEYAENLSTAVEIAQERPEGDLDPRHAVDAYARRLRRLGVRDVSITDESREVRASTDPRNVGRKLATRRTTGDRFVVRGVLGDEGAPPSQHHISTLTVPILAGDRRVGYVVITRVLDDFSWLSRRALYDQVAATVIVFLLGMLLAIYLSWSFARPIADLTRAANRVATGHLDARVADPGGGELAVLSTSFNAMVERLAEQRARAERLHHAERVTALGRLASALAHEIRNPLNSVNLSIDHARSRLAPDEPERRSQFDRLMQGIKSELVRLNRLVNDFLAFGRPARLAPRRCALESLLREVAAVVQPRAQGQGVELIVAVATGAPETVVDPELLKTALLNLVLNALDAMPEGGTLGLRLERSFEDSLLITVTDTGAGMPPEALREAFVPYFSTKEAGLGLGLAITQRIVQEHGGRVFLENLPGGGAAARIELPVRAVEEEAVS